MNILEFAIAKRMSGGGGGQTDEKSIVDAILDKSVTEISSNATSIGKYAFSGCKSLTTANFPLVTSIGDYGFSDCSNLTTANFPLVTSIGDYGFSNCNSLITVNCPIVTSIGKYAFYSCSDLTTVNLPCLTDVATSSVSSCTNLRVVDLHIATNIGRGAFSSDTALTVFVLRSETMCTIYSSAMFKNTPIESGTGYIYVPRALVDTYKEDANWSTYANQFRALEDYTVDGTTTGALDETKI